MCAQFDLSTKKTQIFLIMRQNLSFGVKRWDSEVKEWYFISCLNVRGLRCTYSRFSPAILLPNLWLNFQLTHLKTLCPRLCMPCYKDILAKQAALSANKIFWKMNCRHLHDFQYLYFSTIIFHTDIFDYQINMMFGTTTEI